MMETAPHTLPHFQPRPCFNPSGSQAPPGPYYGHNWPPHPSTGNSNGLYYSSPVPGSVLNGGGVTQLPTASVVASGSHNIGAYSIRFSSSGASDHVNNASPVQNGPGPQGGIYHNGSGAGKAVSHSQASQHYAVIGASSQQPHLASNNPNIPQPLPPPPIMANGHPTPGVNFHTPPSSSVQQQSSAEQLSAAASRSFQVQQPNGNGVASSGEPPNDGTSSYRAVVDSVASGLFTAGSVEPGAGTASVGDKKAGAAAGALKETGGPGSTKFSETQRAKMEEIYRKIPYPSAEEKLRLAEEVSLTKEQVQRWFEGRRKKERQNVISKVDAESPNASQSQAAPSASQQQQQTPGNTNSIPNDAASNNQNNNNNHHHPENYAASYQQTQFCDAPTTPDGPPPPPAAKKPRARKTKDPSATPRSSKKPKTGGKIAKPRQQPNNQQPPPPPSHQQSQLISPMNTPIPGSPMQQQQQQMQQLNNSNGASIIHAGGISTYEMAPSHRAMHTHNTSGMVPVEQQPSQQPVSRPSVPAPPPTRTVKPEEPPVPVVFKEPSPEAKAALYSCFARAPHLAPPPHLAPHQHAMLITPSGPAGGALMMSEAVAAQFTANNNNNASNFQQVMNGQPPPPWLSAPTAGGGRYVPSYAVGAIPPLADTEDKTYLQL